MSAQDTGNVARGHKAAIHNPRISEEAKEHSRQVLNDIERGDVQETQQRGGEDGGERGGERGGFAHEGKAEGRVLGGYKATLKSSCRLFILASLLLNLSL
ncbi:hypothetical protein EWM64_g968 [Hericium alpestre]|uniref:Conidiation protein 6 n=1 Tax=Hericium alpestre TaxID=135208 RepID=A0A4Z0AAQ1_9AGAM|nr:hypothetical protein EWM64_g968 [Hericium alpestre]